MKDLQKRRRVMERSMKLGHCICDPRKPCPCDLLKEKDVCLCAGERLEQERGPVRLTRLVESAGCASKVDQATLKRIVGQLPDIECPQVLVGAPAGDDAGVYELEDGRTIIQTVDVFAPSVDDPYMFGEVAAANSVSDVYAMGARPLTALSIIGFPVRTVADDVMRDILRGGIDKMAEAGVPVVGGHSIKDDQIKAGFAVTGMAEADGFVTNSGARPGDALVLTKPLGVGIISFAAQINRAPEGAVEAATACMTRLNKTASEVMMQVGIHACTDVTGFGLGGHLSEMARSSGVNAEVVWDDLPLLPGVLECAAQGIFSGSVERNREFAGEYLDPADEVTDAVTDICLDAQTSGGLLIALPEEKAEALVDKLQKAGNNNTYVIGRIVEEGTGRVRIVSRGERAMPREKEAPTVQAAQTAAAQAEDSACCPEPEPEAEACCAESGEGGGAAPATGGPAEIEEKFKRFLGSANRPGALDAATKQAVAIALSVVTKCEPCTKMHIQKARKMGFSQEEIDEAAWMAIAFGGSPTMMFYKKFRDS